MRDNSDFRIRAYLFLCKGLGQFWTINGMIIKQAEWCKLWQKSLKIDYQPILDVQAIKPGQKPMQRPSSPEALAAVLL